MAGVLLLIPERFCLDESDHTNTDSGLTAADANDNSASQQKEIEIRDFADSQKQRSCQCQDVVGQQGALPANQAP